jgi:hypothetical protein
VYISMQDAGKQEKTCKTLGFHGPSCFEEELFEAVVCLPMTSYFSASGLDSSPQVLSHVSTEFH